MLVSEGEHGLSRVVVVLSSGTPVVPATSVPMNEFEKRVSVSSFSREGVSPTEQPSVVNNISDMADLSDTLNVAQWRISERLERRLSLIDSFNGIDAISRTNVGLSISTSNTIFLNNSMKFLV